MSKIRKMSPEKGIILAASEGKRMLPLTNYLPKPLIPVQEKPLIVHSIENLERLGTKDIVITLEPRLGAMVQHSIENSYFGESNVEFVYQEKRNGIGFAILKCKNLIGDNSFLVGFPDEFHPNVKNLNASAFNADGTILVIRKQENPSDLIDNLNVSVDEQTRRVVKVSKISAGQKPFGQYHLCGIMAFSPRFFEVLEKFKERKEFFSRGEFSTDRSIQYLIDSGAPVIYVECGGFYTNINTMEDLVTVYRYLYFGDKEK